MKFRILKNKLRDEVKKKIFDGFGSQAIESTGINGLEEDPISFEIFNDQEFVGGFKGNFSFRKMYLATSPEVIKKWKCLP